jgi:cysteinyl-tRNA synthetase
MSKRLGNFYTLRDLLAEGVDPVALRYLLLATHYRQPLNFRRPGLEAAGGAVARLREAARLLKERVNRDPGGTSFDQEAGQLLIHARQAFADALDDDLNISQALAALFELVRGGNSLLEQGLGGAGADRLHGGLLDFDRVVGVLEPAESAGDVLPETLRCMLEEREQARRRREWAEADRLRAQLAEAGILLEDTPEGVRWKRKHS